MSSRAIRRAQQQLEEEQRATLASAQHQNSNGTDEHEDSEEEAPQRPSSNLNPFDMLNDAGDDEQDATAQEESEEEHDDGDGDNEDEETTTDAQKNQKTTTKKKNKKKKKSKAKASTSTPAVSPENDATPPAPKPSTAPEDHSQLDAVLAIETQHLHVMNEMRRLFGRVVDQPSATGGDDNPEARRRRQRGRGQAQESGQRGGLASLGWRHNIFIKGQDNWPKAPSGGLSMEKVGPWVECPSSKASKEDTAVEYRFVHNKNYQAIQQTFVLCVERSDVQGIMNILHENPYHIASLLQLSEVAKSQSDHARAGDFLERALFSFGRAAHSTFNTALTSGTARLDFTRPENREFWLAAWRYIENLGMKGTWRTAYEWAKLLLAIDPENDPYRMSLVIDQIAIRARQFEGYVKISDKLLQKPAEMLKHHFPNILPSTALANHRLDHVDEARNQLRAAVINTPWLFARLYKALNIDPIPASIWGSIAPSSPAHLLTEVYVIGSKAIWNTPENTTFLTSIVSSVDRYDVDIAIMEELPIHVTEARHTLLLHNAALDALVPAVFREVFVSYDPLPPKDNKPSYALPTGVGERVYPAEEVEQGDLQEAMEEMVRLLARDAPEQDEQDDQDWDDEV
ncbi:MAG: hypothetical protein M1835_000266 [Candelina submexicana]|nr:MAG: hypothetical protein M1835_000266 [Candelina submexicana]